VLTGSLSGLTREQARERVEAAGGRVAEAVSARTDYVVVGEDPGSKLEAARRLGIPRLDERGFLELVGGQRRRAGEGQPRRAP
jgi:DNA ligase (NAD+)